MPKFGRLRGTYYRRCNSGQMYWGCCERPEFPLTSAGLVIGFVLPGHGSIVHDLLKDIVIAPAMLGATGLAAEAAVEGYVAQRRNQIIEKLLAEARKMAATLYAMPLDAIGNAVMQTVGALGVQQDVLDRLPLNLQRLRLELASHTTGAGA